jgi:uncharacterized protein (DUF2236 family)
VPGLRGPAAGGTGITVSAVTASPDVDLRNLIDGAVLLASTANAVMQLARPAVGYAVVESKVDSGQTMRCPFRRIRNTVTYMSVAMMAPRRNAPTTGAR